MKHLNMKAKLGIIIAVILIPFVILQSVGIATHHKGMMNSEYSASRNYAEAISTAFTNYLDNLWDTEHAIGLFISTCPEEDIELIEEYMRGVMQTQPAVLRYSWVGLDGKIIASTIDGALGISLSDREYIWRIKSGQERVAANIVQGRLGEETILPVAYGIKKDGKLTSIVVAAVDASKIGVILPSYRGSNDGLYGIVDRNGRIVYLNNNPDMSFDKRTVKDDSPAWEALSGEVVMTDHRISGFDGKNRMRIDVPINDIGWECFVTMPVAEVLANNIRGIRQSIVVMILVTLVSLLTALLVGRRILKPIEVLKRASESISKGDLTVRTNIEGSDELAAAGKAFDQMADRIQKLEVSRELFFKTSAHEMRNPMTSIIGIVSLIRRKISNGKPLDSITGMLDTLGNEVGRLSRILNEILDAYRVQEQGGSLKEHGRATNILGVAASAMEPFKVSDDRHVFIFDSKIQGPVWVYGDPERLEDVFRNLFCNAAKYSPANTEVKVSFEMDADSIIISIKDQGIGIPEDQLTKIFESFYRSDNLRGCDPGGMGLGLYICSDIIKRHNGSIWAQNNEDRGSTFFVKLPILRKTGEV